MHRCGFLQRTEFLTVSTLGGSDGLERTDLFSTLTVSLKNFVTVSTLEGVVVFKELIYNSFYLSKVLWSGKNWC